MIPEYDFKLEYIASKLKTYANTLKKIKIVLFDIDKIYNF